MEGYRALILDAVFPRRCLSCNEFGAWCCESCLADVELTHRDPCTRCGTLTEHECTTQDATLDDLIVIGFYHDPILRELLHTLKYHSATELHDTFASLIRLATRDRNRPWPWAGEKGLALQAVIGSPDRVRARGFDQAEIVRDLVKQELLPWAKASSLLVRGQAPSVQADLEPGPLRNANVQGIFSFCHPGRSQTETRDPAVVPEAVLLVDDVYTTGSTMKEAARVLKRAGVQRVYGFAMAIGK